jgi:hypothetical protein
MRIVLQVKADGHRLVSVDMLSDLVAVKASWKNIHSAIAANTDPKTFELLSKVTIAAERRCPSMIVGVNTDITIKINRQEWVRLCDPIYVEDELVVDALQVESNPEKIKLLERAISLADGIMDYCAGDKWEMACTAGERKEYQEIIGKLFPNGVPPS